MFSGENPAPSGSRPFLEVQAENAALRAEVLALRLARTLIYTMLRHERPDLSADESAVLADTLTVSMAAFLAAVRNSTVAETGDPWRNVPADYPMEIG